MWQTSSNTLFSLLATAAAWRNGGLLQIDSELAAFSLDSYSLSLSLLLLLLLLLLALLTSHWTLVALVSIDRY